MAKTRLEDIRSGAAFGRKLFLLGEKNGYKGPAAIAEALYRNNDCFKVLAPRGRREKYKFNEDKDKAAIMRRVQDHLDLENAYDVSSNYLFAYSILFNCSMDFLYGRIDVECPNLEILDISKKTGLSIEVSKRLTYCSKDGESLLVDDWSAILESDLYNSVPADWRFITHRVYEKMELEAQLEGLEWEKSFFSDNNIDPFNKDIVLGPRDIDDEIKTVKEEIANIDAAFYGMLSKVSKNISDFIELNARGHYERFREETIEARLKMIKRSYGLLASEFGITI